MPRWEHAFALQPAGRSGRRRGPRGFQPRASRVLVTTRDRVLQDDGALPTACRPKTRESRRSTQKGPRRTPLWPSVVSAPPGFIPSSLVVETIIRRLSHPLGRVGYLQSLPGEGEPTQKLQGDTPILRRIKGVISTTTAAPRLHDGIGANLGSCRGLFRPHEPEKRHAPAAMSAVVPR
jgi:hypothetical protein